MSTVMIESTPWSLAPRVTRRALLVCWLAILFAGYFLGRMLLACVALFSLPSPAEPTMRSVPANPLRAHRHRHPAQALAHAPSHVLISLLQEFCHVR